MHVSMQDVSWIPVAHINKWLLWQNVISLHLIDHQWRNVNQVTSDGNVYASQVQYVTIPNLSKSS